MNSDTIKTNVRIISSKNSWIEGEAVRQLYKTSELDGVEYCVGLPDLHPGRGNPIGAAYLVRDRIYPYLIGNDVGCGIGLFQTDIKKNKIKINKWLKKCGDINQPWEIDLKQWMDEFELSSSKFDMALGTLGGGNHFIEIQAVDRVYKKEMMDGFKINKDSLYILVHSGSRAFGEFLLRKHTSANGAKGLSVGSPEAEEYLSQHDYAVKWAACNRTLIAHRFAMDIGAKINAVTDVCHNSITLGNDGEKDFWLHRKGAAVSGIGLIVIPGSRGSLSYLVRPIGDQKGNLWSLPHGAGRKWNRRACKERLRDRFNIKSLTQTEIGSHVICDDKDLLYEEAPQAYKNIDQVIEDLIDKNLIEVVATLKPILTYKNRNL